jgi:endo-1,3-1,4-beta-glycanase ExoK
MRQVFVLMMIAFVQVVLFAGLATAGALDFTDNFTSFDTARWSKGDHYLGRSRLDPNNVSAAGGNLKIKLPARSLNGGEIFSNAHYEYGSYAARIKLPQAPSSITGFFLYEPPDYKSEIDIEIYNDSSGRVLFTTYAGGQQTHSEEMKLPFDPTTGFHEYRFDRAPGSASFYVDGRLMKEWSTGLPQDSMRIYVNAWFPRWLAGKRPLTDHYVLVDQIRHTGP